MEGVHFRRDRRISFGKSITSVCRLNPVPYLSM